MSVGRAEKGAILSGKEARADGIVKPGDQQKIKKEEKGPFSPVEFSQDAASEDKTSPSGFEKQLFTRERTGQNQKKALPPLTYTIRCLPEDPAGQNRQANIYYIDCEHRKRLFNLRGPRRRPCEPRNRKCSVKQPRGDAQPKPLPSMSAAQGSSGPE